MKYSSISIFFIIRYSLTSSLPATQTMPRRMIYFQGQLYRFIFWFRSSTHRYPVSGDHAVTENSRPQQTTRRQRDRFSSIPVWCRWYPRAVSGCPCCLSTWTGTRIYKQKPKCGSLRQRTLPETSIDKSMSARLIVRICKS